MGAAQGLSVLRVSLLLYRVRVVVCSRVHTFKSVGLLVLCTLAVLLGPSRALAAGPGVSTVPGQRVGLATVTIGSFNVHKGSANLPNTEERLNLIADELLRGGFDVVGLQESANKMQRAITARVSSTYEYARLGIALKDDPTHAHNPSGGQIFYRPSVLRPAGLEGIIDLPTPGGPTRKAVYALFDVVSTGARFLFVSAHMLVGGGLENANYRSMECTTLLDRIADMNPGWPVVVVGDMNSDRGARYVYDAPAKVFPARGMSEVFSAVGTVGHGDFNSFNGLSAKPLKGGFHPDRMFVSAGIPVLSAEVMVRLAGKRYATPFASDHNPIRAVVQIPY